VSASDDTPTQSDLDRLLGWWMDGNAQTEEPPVLSALAPQSAEETAGQSDDRGRSKAGEWQLVHALLLQLSNQEGAERQARINRAIQAIRQAQADSAAQETSAVEPVRQHRGRFRAFIRWAIAVSLLLAAVSWLYVSDSNPALAALDRVVQALDDPIDRTYEISVELMDQPAPREPARKPSKRTTEVVPPEDRRPGLDGAILYIRDHNQFVLYRRTPDGKSVINGGNGRETWLIRPERPILVSSSPSAFRIPMPENLATVPFVDIRATLTSLREAYQIVELPAERLASNDPAQWRHLQARKIDPATKGPKVVSVWFHPTTNLIGRIQFEQMHLQGRPEPRRMTIALVAHQPLPANWFDHDAHHSPDTPIERVAP
jgi:hypothetical protein